MEQHSFSHINLIQTKTKGSAQLADIEQSLRKAAIISLITFVIIGALVAGIYIFYTLQRNAIEKNHAEFLTQINAAKNKEGLLLSIKDRTKIVSMVISAQHSWSEMLDSVSTVAVPPALTTISADEQNKVVVSFSGDTIDSVIEPIGRLIALAGEDKIQNPELVSVQFASNGAVVITVSLQAVFN